MRASVEVLGLFKRNVTYCASVELTYPDLQKVYLLCRKPLRHNGAGNVLEVFEAYSHEALIRLDPKSSDIRWRKANISRQYGFTPDDIFAFLYTGVFR